MKDFISEYVQREQLVRKIDFENMTEADYIALQKYAQDKNFITDIEKSVTFLETTTGYVIPKSIADDVEFKGILPMEDLLESYKVLSCGGNRTFLDDFVRRNALHTDIEDLSDGRVAFDLAKECSIIDDTEQSRITLCDAVRDSDSEKVLDTQNDFLYVNKEYKREDLETEILKVKETAKEYGIDLDTSYKDTCRAFSSAFNKGGLKDYDLESYRKTKESPQVIISNDGYVMNTSEQGIETDNAVAEIAKDGKEVNNTPVVETTNDITAVKSNVKLETVSDVGSMERRQVDTGHGVDADIDKMADQAVSYEPQTDRSALRKNKFDMDRD